MNMLANAYAFKIQPETAKRQANWTNVGKHVSHTLAICIMIAACHESVRTIMPCERRDYRTVPLATSNETQKEAELNS